MLTRKRLFVAAAVTGAAISILGGCGVVELGESGNRLAPSPAAPTPTPTPSPTPPPPAPTPAPPSPPPAPPPPAPPPGTATLGWTAPSDPDVQGYRVYFGTATRAYVQSRGAGLNAGLNTQYTVAGLQRGQLYYFAVTAYDMSGNESTFSAEASRQVQ